MLEGLFKNSMLAIVTLVNIGVSVALVYVSLEAYRIFRLKIFKQSFMIFMLASYILLAGSMIIYFGLESWLQYSMFKLFIIFFTTFGILLAVGIMKMIEAAQTIGIGVMAHPAETEKKKKKK